MTMTPPPQLNLPPPQRRRLPLVLTLVIGGVLFLLGLLVLNRGEVPTPKQYLTQQITIVTPPPPPPPPEEKVVEPEEVIEPVEPAKVQEDVQQVSEQPTPEPASAEPAGGLDRPSDIGADSFRLSSGSGGNPFGRGRGGGGSWDAYVASHIRRALQADPRTRGATGYLEVLLSIDPNGRFERAELQSSTGDHDLDAAIREVLSRLAPLSRGRPPDVKALTVTGINIRATEN